MSTAQRSRRLVVGLVYGGANTEHEVSLASASSIAAALDDTLFDVRLLRIDRGGRWHRVETLDAEVSAATGSRLPYLADIDVVFPALHGRFGEDGTVQALCELAGVPYVGSGVLACALAMDKSRASLVVEAAGVPVIPTATVRRGAVEGATIPWEGPLFVKPNRAGSSVGASLVSTHHELPAALVLALAEDDTALVQPALDAIEVDVALLRGPDGIVRSGPPLRIRHGASFFDYASKYDDGGASFEIPAQLPRETLDGLSAAALTAFDALDCDDLARADFFVLPDGDIRFIEMNTMPGMTSHSQFPQIWAAAGLPFTELLTVLVDGAR